MLGAHAEVLKITHGSGGEESKEHMLEGKTGKNKSTVSQALT